MKRTDLIKMLSAALLIAATVIAAAPSAQALTLANARPIHSPSVTGSPGMVSVAAGGVFDGVSGGPVTSSTGEMGFMLTPVGGADFVIGLGSPGSMPLLAGSFVESAVAGDVLTALFENDDGTSLGDQFAEHLLMTIVANEDIAVTGGMYKIKDLTIVGARVIPLPAPALLLLSGLAGLGLLRRRA